MIKLKFSSAIFALPIASACAILALLTLLTVAACTPGSGVRLESLTSPALSAEESATVKAHRIAHGTIREAAAALDLAYQYIGRKAQPCKGVASSECAALKVRLQALHNRVSDKERELDRARKLLALSDISSAKTQAQLIRDALALLQQEILKVD